MKQKVMIEENYDMKYNFKELYSKLIDYVMEICNLSERKCNDLKSRVELSNNLSNTSALIINNLVQKECKKRGWIIE